MNFFKVVSFSMFAFLCSLTFTSFAQNTCEADHNVLLTDFSFTPNSLVILPGETVAFINVQGTHSVNGVNSTVTGESFNNPMEFSFPESEGTTEGTCMGVVTFDVPGTYTYDCGVGFHAELGMIGTINVDGFSLSDLMASNTLPESFQSGYALNSYYSNYIDPNATNDINLNGAEPYTVFLPNDAAVDGIRDDFGDPEISQFDFLGFIDLPAALRYNIVEGVYMAEDLQDGQLLMTTYGQNLTVSEVNGAFMVDDATIISTNYTADNGVVHIIDKILAPSGLPSMSVWSVIEDSEEHQFFEDAITVAGYKSLLRKQSEMVGNSQSPEGPFTVFAPTDAAFQAFAQSAGTSTIDLLYSSLLTDIVGSHVVESTYLSSDISNGTQLLNYENDYLQMTVNAEGIFVNGIEITVTDVLAYNGVVHVIDAVLFEAADIPSPVGTCGTWTLNMYDDDGDGWEDTDLYVEVDGEIISIENGPVASSASFEFAVDEGDLVSLYYLPAGFGGNQYYSVVDGNNQLVTSSGQQEGNSIGLLACPSTPTCGMIEIVMTHEYGDGWWSNSLEVYKNDVLYLPIPFYFNYEQTTFIQSDNEDVFDFVYVGGQSFEPEYEGYRIYGPDGGLVINQDISGQIPESTVDIKFCEDQSGIEELESSQIKIYPNPTNGLIDIKVSENFLGSDVILYDVQGKIVGNWPLWNGDRLDLSAYKEGLYLIELQSKSKKVRSRVVLN
ncbi:MAG: fasciclin domain-containing protein [Crocinitomicaceae bacterium]|tara:strand:+ start:6290 stop:8461 length:2172 start_codon:yes stop_codon:yes gene_type:complete